MSQNDNAVEETVEQTAATGSAPEENQTVVTEDDDLLEKVKDFQLDGSQLAETESEAEDKPEASADETQTETQTSQDEQQQSPQDTWDSLNGKSQERFQQMANERNELRRQLEEARARQAQFATEQDLVNEINPETGEYYTPQEIERISWLQGREALSERNAQDMFNLQVQQNQMAINDEAIRVTQDIPLLNPNDKENFDPEIAQHYVELLNDNLIYLTGDNQQVNRSTLLQNGIDPDTQATLVGYATSPYKLAKFAADSVSRASARAETLGQAKAQKAQERMLANADVSSSAPQSGGNTLDDLFDRVKDIRLS